MTITIEYIWGAVMVIPIKSFVLEHEIFFIRGKNNVLLTVAEEEVKEWHVDNG